jgi:hypothetical protein
MMHAPEKEKHNEEQLHKFLVWQGIAGRNDWRDLSDRRHRTRIGCTDDAFGTGCVQRKHPAGP